MTEKPVFSAQTGGNGVRIPNQDKYRFVCLGRWAYNFPVCSSGQISRRIKCMEFGEDFDIIVESGKADCTVMCLILEVKKGINDEENYHLYRDDGQTRQSEHFQVNAFCRMNCTMLE